MRYWLIKSDPQEFGWDDLKNCPEMKTAWDGVRNYQARNYLKEMRKGDLALFYHSGVKPPQIMGVVEIVREAYPDSTQFVPGHPRYDPKSNPDNPRWFMVDVQYVGDFNPPIIKDELQNIPRLQVMILFKNSRLSIQPVTAAEWSIITSLRLA
ncbi:MAG: EVE domain-containing protein [Calditrichia bacterium]